MRRTALTWITVIAAATLVAHACGYAFGAANQTTYFLQALHRAHPELFRNDWLVANTSEYHTIFSSVAAVLFRIDDSGATAFGIVHVICMVALLCGLFFLVQAATRSASLSIFVLVTGWLAVNGEQSVAGSYLWSGYLQPSLIASAAWLIALGLHVRGRPLATGIALALGGIFHANFLLLGIGVFSLAELLAEREGRVGRVALLLAPQLVALAVLVPELLAHAGGSDRTSALWVLVQFHAPLHYKPSWIARTLPSLLSWVALAVLVTPVAIELGDRKVIRRLVRWSVIAAAICTGVTLVAMIPALLSLTRLYVWRLAPFAIVTAQIVIAMAAAAVILIPRAWQAVPRWRSIAAALLFVVIAARTPSVAEASWTIWLTLAGVALAFVVPASQRRLLLPAIAVVTFAAPLWYRRGPIVHPRLFVPSDGPADGQLYDWARTASSPDAVFLTPPDLYRFRFVARRAIYADFKSPPLAEDELVQWHARLCRMTGALLKEKLPAHRHRWLAATGDELLVRAKQLGVDYLVLDRTAEHDRIAAMPVFRNDAFAVYATAPTVP